MKTTKGKTKPAEAREERVIRIYSVDGRKIIAQISAKKFKDALISYFESTYARKSDDWQYKVVGNTMQVFKPGKPNTVRVFRALELYQAP